MEGKGEALIKRFLDVQVPTTRTYDMWIASKRKERRRLPESHALAAGGEGAETGSEAMSCQKLPPWLPPRTASGSPMTTAGDVTTPGPKTYSLPGGYRPELFLPLVRRIVVGYAVCVRVSTAPDVYVSREPGLFLHGVVDPAADLDGEA